METFLAGVKKSFDFRFNCILKKGFVIGGKHCPATQSLLEEFAFVVGSFREIF